MLSRALDIGLDKSVFESDNIIRYWASNAYKRINSLLRLYLLDHIYDTAPNVYLYLQRLIRYSQQNGLSNKDVYSLQRNLYRGIDFEIDPDEIFVDNDIMGSSLSKSVANDFANLSKGKNGTIFIIKTSKLPNDMRYILIDEKIDPMYHEKEVLLFPGIFEPYKKLSPTSETSTAHKELFVLYKQHKAFMEIVDKPEPPNTNIQHGGMANVITYDTLYNKHIILYRCIEKRETEVLRTFYVTDKKEDMREVLQQMKYYSAYYDGVMRLIPEVQDIMKTARSAKGKRGIATLRRYMSYFLYEAIYDPVTKTVLTVRGMVPFITYDDKNLNEREEEIKQAIWHHFNKNKSI